jgi:nicotinamide-nucleotide adenylyltransferase
MTHPLGLIHGRFQVLHNDHLTYLMAGWSRCENLIVGITNPTPAQTEEETTDPNRSSRANNPLTYEEREKMVLDAMVEAGVEKKKLTIIPFPICKTEELIKVAPKDAIYYLTIYDAWGYEKRDRLQSLGLTTEVMWEKDTADKGLTATAIRLAIAEDRDWEPLVPPAVARLIKKWNLQTRLSQLRGPSSGS